MNQLFLIGIESWATKTVSYPTNPYSLLQAEVISLYADGKTHIIDSGGNNGAKI